ncbi:MAG: imidazolonepropionase [Sphingobacteriales bacterium]|nr:imidazolonepropionase [Sphingobacteriales bacterium]
MLTTLFTHIGLLAGTRDTHQLLRGHQLADLPCMEDAYLLVEDEQIADYGYMYELALKLPQLPKNIIDVQGRYILPCWCDSHTHLVFAGSRENEFIFKLQGLSYAEIAAKGGGILNSAKKLNETREEELLKQAEIRLQQVAELGTGAIEMKSGYGLSVAGELKMLRVIKQLKQRSKLSIKASFLGAHTYPEEFKNNHAGYIKLILEEMLPVIAAENLADYIDVFCETGFFSPAETEQICKAGACYGLRPKLHVNQLNSIGGIQTGMAAHALSLDHLETLTAEEISLLGKFEGCSTLLPTAAFFLRMPYQPARALIGANAAVVLASDYNPGSSPSGNMNLVNAISCIQMKMFPQEVINASTLNGAYAMDLQNEVGSITIGKNANLILLKPIPSLAYLFYSFGLNHIEKVMIRGSWV